MALIEIKGLTKLFGNRKAVDNVSFEIQKGEAFGLLGPNGAGKTTLVSMLVCLLRPTSGDAVLDGSSIVHDPMMVKRKIGFVPQEISLYGPLTALENLQFWAKMYDVPPRERTRKIEALLELVGLSDRKKERIDRYSGGMKRRINIAVGLLPDPKLLILDEPTVGVDPQSRSAILYTLRHLNQQGLTLLYTSHYMEEVEFLCPRVGIMDSGKIIALGTQEELRLLVGERDSLRIFTQTLVPEKIKDEISNVEGVSEVRTGENFIGLLATRGRRALPSILELLNERGVKVKSVEIKEPNLENVFLHLTGKELRE
ncbi:MAG: ABC transporter ATP-binding protein [Caldiserica bacterium]|jgi:ABC-2 type transport system ATP-binding protein|nr:ABC transporter ATP-binding protein [Caldisericota bacterium]MDH7563217.1 ABC transporter ATP-binding protein [Caldisericota bacterium]